MALLSFHCDNFKAGALTGIDGHNRRLHNNHKSNPDIKKELSHTNRIYKAPKKGLYADCKELIEKKVLASGHRVRKDSNWICECIFYYPEGMPLERLDEFNTLIIDYMCARLGKENLLEAVCHLDETRPHLHLDMAVITEDNRLSSKSLITREFITSIHDLLPVVLQHHGFNVERGEAGHIAGLSAKEYKKRMEEEAKQLNKRLEDMAIEYNKLVDEYNRLIDDKKRLEHSNIEKAKEIIYSKQKNR